MRKRILILTLFLCLWLTKAGPGPEEPDQRLAPGGVIPPGVGAVGTPTIGTPIVGTPITTTTPGAIPAGVMPMDSGILRAMFPGGVPGMELLAPALGGAGTVPTGVAGGLPVAPAVTPAVVTPTTIPIPGDFRPREPVTETTSATPSVRFYQDDLGRIYYYDPAGSGRRFYVDEYGNSYYYDQYGRRFFLDPSVASIMDGTYDPGREPPGAASAPTVTPTTTTPTATTTPTTIPVAIPSTGIPGATIPPIPTAPAGYSVAPTGYTAAPTTVPTGYTAAPTGAGTFPGITAPTAPAGLSLPVGALPFGLEGLGALPTAGGAIPLGAAIPAGAIPAASGIPVGAAPAGAPVVRTAPASIGV